MAAKEYPLEEKCALVITPVAAAVIQMQDCLNRKDIRDLPKIVQKALNRGMTPWQCATDSELSSWLHSEDWDNLSDAYDVLSSADVENLVYCSEFTGQGGPSEDAPNGPDLSYCNDYIVLLTPLKSSSLFKAAYANVQELIDEYKSRLEKFISPDFPYEKFLADISGTYYC